MKTIPLRARDGSIRAHALVDDEDYERLALRRWSLSAQGYAVRGESRDGKKATVLMHRELTGTVDGEVDHANRNRLDNRRENLRPATRAQNGQNMTAGRGISKHRGVGWNAARGKWVAYASGKYLGIFMTEEHAAQVAVDYRQQNMPYATN